jgi:hypothetical protein
MFGRYKFKPGWSGYCDPITAITIGISAVSAVSQYESGRKQAAAAQQGAQAQREGIAAQGRMANVDAQRQRLQQIREARIRRGAVLAGAGSTGLGPGTSAVSGATSSITSQAASNIGTVNQTQTFANQASAASQRAADAASAGTQAQATGQQWQTINTIFGASKADFTTVFGGNTIPKA